MTYFDSTARRIIRDYSNLGQIENRNHNDETDPEIQLYYLKRCIDYTFIVDAIEALRDVREALKNPDCSLDDLRKLTAWDSDEE